MCTIWTRRNARVNLPVTSFAGVTILTPHRAQKTRAGPGQPESRATPSDQQRAHRLEGAAERVEDEAEDLQGDDAEQRFRIVRLPEDDRRMPVPLGKREVAFRHGAVDGRAIGEHALHLTLGRETDGLPHGRGQERVRRSAVDEEANARFLPRGTVDGAVDVADTHAPEYGIPDRERRHPKIADEAISRQGSIMQSPASAGRRAALAPDFLSPGHLPCMS